MINKVQDNHITERLSNRGESDQLIHSATQTLKPAAKRERPHSEVYILISPAQHFRKGQRKTGSAVARAGLVGRAVKQRGVERVEFRAAVYSLVRMHKEICFSFLKKKKMLSQS